MAVDTGDDDRQAGAGGRRLKLERYVLDLDRGCLMLDNDEIALRPKTFSVLLFLVENSGRLVSKDEVFATVWPDVTVTDDTLVQSIGELRRALGDQGARLIKTVPRRGYRFDAAVTALSVEDPTSAAAALIAQENLPAVDDERAAEPAPMLAMGDPPVANPVPSEALGGGSRQSRLGISSGASRMLEVVKARRQVGIIPCRVGTAAALLAAALLSAAAVLRSRPPMETSAVSSQAAVRQAAIPSMAARPVVAILPFANLSDDKAREYFADGVTQDIINALGRFAALTVMSWNAVAHYKGKPAHPDEVARRLTARYLVEGSVRQSGDRVRVTTQLVGVDARVIWSGRFEEALTDLFTLQDRITAQIAGALAIRVTQLEQQRVLAKPTGNLEAYDLVLQARLSLQRPTRANNAEARALLRRAIGLDPKYAAAHAALGETFHIAVALGWAESPLAWIGRAEEAANVALRINESELAARILVGRLHIFHDRYEQALIEMERAIAINSSDAHGLGGRGNILKWLGRTDEAIEVLELAQRIDPELNSVDRFSLAMSYYLKRQYHAAIDQSLLNIRNAESFPSSYPLLAAAYAQAGGSEDADRVVAYMRRRHPTFDPQAFGNKFRNPADLERIRDGLRKAGFVVDQPGKRPASGN